MQGLFIAVFQNMFAWLLRVYPQNQVVFAPPHTNVFLKIVLMSNLCASQANKYFPGASCLQTGINTVYFPLIGFQCQTHGKLRIPGKTHEVKHPFRRFP